MKTKPLSSFTTAR